MTAETISASEARLLEAMLLQWQWKTPAMRAMDVAICRLALARGKEPFSANDLPDFNPGGTGITGAAFRGLLKLRVLARVGHFAGGTFYQLRVRNPGGNPIGVYRLDCGGLARALLRAHGERGEEFRQGELTL